MNASRIVALLVAANLVSGCALFAAAGIKTPPSVGVPQIATDAAALLKQAEAKAAEKCDPIRNAVIAWPEERAMGGVVAVNKVGSFGGLALEGMTATDPDALAKDVADKKKVTLPDGPKNDLTAYVSVVGRNLAKYSTRPDIAWTFAVMENDTPNAISAPGGYVVVTTGLLKKITNEAQLAGVLSHEIAHIVHKHSLKRYQTSKADSCAAAVGGGYFLSKAAEGMMSFLPPKMREAAQFSKEFDNFDMDDPKKGKFVVFIMDAVMALIDLLGNETEDEFQADATALELVSFAGYDPSEYEKFLTLLGNAGSAKHPSTPDRVAKLKALREGDLAPFATGTAKPDTAKAFAPLGASK